MVRGIHDDEVFARLNLWRAKTSFISMKNALEKNLRSQAVTTTAPTPSNERGSNPPSAVPTAPTIAAIATPRGAGGIAIIRVSGSSALSILREAFRPAHSARAFEPSRMMYGHVISADHSVIDEALAVFMPGPHSYTREDVAEIHCHGGDVAARRTLSRILDLGALPAGPGEFTKRAFLSGRIDLARAEAVMQLIGANSEAAARASVRQLEGGVSGFVRDASARILDQLALIEASTDFPDEVEEEAASEQVAEGLRAIIAEITRRCDPKGARMLREGASIVLAGRPNVGKSSLMNALLNQERAIVTAIPGTTRDVLTERITIGGVTAELSDTAGQRDTLDPVEKIGVDRARNAVETADIVLIVLDASSEMDESDRELLRDADGRTLVCLNKMDLDAVLSRAAIAELTDVEIIELSASTGHGMQTLTEALEARLSANLSEDNLTVERHIALAQEAVRSLGRALDAIGMAMPLDVVSLDLKSALESLSEITATDATEDVITEIFARFCVGK